MGRRLTVVPAPGFNFAFDIAKIGFGGGREQVGPPVDHILGLIGGTVKTTCSDGRCPQPVSLDREAELQGLCYFHTKVKAGLIVDFYEGPTYDEEGHQVVAGELVPVTLP